MKIEYFFIKNYDDYTIYMNFINALDSVYCGERIWLYNFFRYTDFKRPYE